eukprot:PhF_6_TR43416/c0_g1_i2/m.66701
MKSFVFFLAAFAIVFSSTMVATLGEPTTSPPSTDAPTAAPTTTTAAPTTTPTAAPTDKPTDKPTTAPGPTAAPPTPTPTSTVFNPITSYADIASSGSVYPKCLPIAQSQIFSNKKVLFLLSDGAEDVEITYPYQYLTERGAKVDFGCMNTTSKTTAYIFDFYKPTYSLTCASYGPYDVDFFKKYDAIFIPGGIPSSSNLRTDTKTLSALRDWVDASATPPPTTTASPTPAPITTTAAPTPSPSPTNAPNGTGAPTQPLTPAPTPMPVLPDRVLAIICSGIETTIVSKIFEDPVLAAQVRDQPLTGSPASEVVMVNYLQRSQNTDLKSSANGYATTEVSTYSTATKKTAIILGRDPNANPAWVTAISLKWMNVNEMNMTNINQTTCENATVLKPDPAVFTPITDIKSLPQGNSGTGSAVKTGTVNCVNPTGRNFCYSYMQVGILISHGSHDNQVLSLYQSFASQGIVPTFVCPDWIGKGSNKVYLSQDPPTYISYWVNCSLGTTQARGMYWDMIAIPGGLLSTHSVLRNDLTALSYATYGGLTILSDTAIGLATTNQMRTALLGTGDEVAKKQEELRIPSSRYNDVDLAILQLQVTTAQSAIDTDEFGFSGSNATCTTCNIPKEIDIMSGKRVLVDYVASTADPIVIGVSAGAALVLVGFFSFLFAARS